MGPKNNFDKNAFGGEYASVSFSAGIEGVTIGVTIMTSLDAHGGVLLGISGQVGIGVSIPIGTGITISAGESYIKGTW